MFDKIPIWFTWKKNTQNCCLFEYPEYKVYSFVAIHIMFKAYHLFKVGISQLSYPSTKIAYLPGCTRIFYSDISIRVKNNLISITHRRGAIIHEKWRNPPRGFLWMEILCALVSASHNCDVSGSVTFWDRSNFTIIVLPVTQGIYQRLYLFTQKVSEIREEGIKMSLWGGLSLLLSTLEDIFHLCLALYHFKALLHTSYHVTSSPC